MERAENRFVASKQFLVIGGGWAGISTVSQLLHLGVPARNIRLIERTLHGGGRAFSFRDKTTGLELDNGQHVVLGCCTSFVDLLREFKLSHGVRFQPLLRVPVYARGQRYDILSRRLAGAFHLLPGLLTYGHLNASERLRVLSVASRLLRSPPPRLDDISFADWLRQHEQDDRLVDEFWDLLGTAILNGHADDVSARLAVEAFRIGVVAGWSPARLGLFQIPLGTLAKAALDGLATAGVQVQMACAVDDISHDGQIATGVRLRSGTHIEADVVISTVPHDALYRMLPTSWSDHPFMQRFEDFRWSPILNLFLLYDKPILDEDLFASTALGGMFVFNRGRLMANDDLDGRWLSVSISAADKYRSALREDVERWVIEAIEEMCPPARSAQVVNVSTVWQPLATFLAKPGTWSKRPTAKTPFAGLILAGDWTDTGWPASLEGAVRSGQTAAAQAIKGN